MDGDGEFTLFNDDLYTYRTIGANTLPTITCGNNGEVAVAWAGISEVDVYNELYNYRRIWTRTSLMMAKHGLSITILIRILPCRLMNVFTHV